MQLRMTDLMMKHYHLFDLDIDPKLRKSMLRHLTRMLAMCIMGAALATDDEGYKKIAALRNELKEFDEKMLRKVERHPMIFGQRILLKFGHKFNRRFYGWLGKTFNFN